MEVEELQVGQRVRIPGKGLPDFVIIGAKTDTAAGVRLYVDDEAGKSYKVDLTLAELQAVLKVAQDGAAEPSRVLAALWSEWMRATSASSGASVLAATPLRPYAHQSNAVYGAMLPQPMLRFLLADEPGTGKTIMGGLWLRESQRLGFVRRALVVCPAHLVSKWQQDFDRFFGGPDCLRRITADTVREHAVGVGHDMWVVSLELAGMNPSVLEAIHPDRVGWDAIVFDEAHRMTPTAAQWHRVGLTLTKSTPRVLLMTATPHRGNEWLFRSLMHLVDPEVFPPVDRVDADDPGRALRPGTLHFLRRMKEELVDYDNQARLFKGRHAQNLPVPLNVPEQAFYSAALELVDRYFPTTAATLARMVYGKRAASSLHALAETLRRRRDGMGGVKPPVPAGTVSGDPFDADENDEEEDDVVYVKSESEREEKKAIAELLGDLDSHLGDKTKPISKLPRLLENCLAVNNIRPGNDEQAVIFTEFADTADWLVDLLGSKSFSTRRYSGRDNQTVRDVVRADFEARKFQILVSTDAGNEGIDLQSAHVLVNWDIPWSLVRLEQRMGRIHRIGQTRDVELYNLIATGTREGDAHARLMDNLCAAANELNGKMFDSLSLVAELALSEAGIEDLERLLAKSYESGGTADSVTHAITQITKDRLRQIHDMARKSEDDLASGIDMAKAIAALHDERLERINPHIVERFLSRLTRAGLIGMKRSSIADEGMWFLEERDLPLPGEFSKPSTLIATSGRAKRTALDLGAAAAAQALTLGPGEPAFAELAAAASRSLRPDLYEGAQLVDPNSITDYDLYVYEVAMDEGNGRRRTHSGYLIRSDATGAARAIKWETLANLDAGTKAPKTPHPVLITHADTAARLRLESDMKDRRKALDRWLGESRTQLGLLPNDLTDHIAEPMNHPGSLGGSTPWKRGWSNGSTEAVQAVAAPLHAGGEGTGGPPRPKAA